MKKFVKLAMGFAFLALSPFYVQAQQLDPVKLEITNQPETVKGGEVFEITVSASIDGNWHLYSINNDPNAGPYPTQFSSANNQLAIAGKIKESKPTVEYDPNFDTDLGWHESEATFTIPLAFRPTTNGNGRIDLKVLYQVCNDKVCLPPKTKSITSVISVAGTASEPYQGFDNSGNSNGNSSAFSGSNNALQQANNQQSIEGDVTQQPVTSGYGNTGIFSFLWIALTAGFAALLTPCVFPIIPLTVSFFSKQNRGSHGRNVLQALLFGAAIVVTFTVLGALLAALIGVSGANRFASNPWVNLFIGIILVVFALSLLGMFELRLPYQFTNWLNRKSNDSTGVTGILFMALTISAVSFSCTAPFVGGVLAATANGQWFYPILGMIGFSTAFASPFVLFALFPSWLESLPKSGSWMNIAKVLLGFIEFAAAFKFISNADLVWEWGIVSRPLTIAAWITIFFLAGLYILGTFSLKHEKKPEQIGTGRLLLAIPFFLFSFYLIPGLLGASLGIWDAWLPPKKATDVSIVYSLMQNNGGIGNNNKSEDWSNSYETSVETAKEAGVPVFIDFTGYTCTNCRAMEANVFPQQEIQDRFGKMEKVRLYTDDGTDGLKNQKFQFQLTGTVALPTYAIVDPYTGKILKRLVGYTGKEKFQQFLDSGLAQFIPRKMGSAAVIN